MATCIINHVSALTERSINWKRTALSPTGCKFDYANVAVRSATYHVTVASRVAVSESDAGEDDDDDDDARASSLFRFISV